MDEEDDDESVDSFFSRRFGDAFARTLGSALVHGIYAAESRLLSLRAAFPQLRASEARGKGSVIWGELGPPAWFGSKTDGDDKAQGQEEEGGDREWEAQLRRTAALFSFREGMETLVRGLVGALQGFSNVALRSGVAVRGIGIDAAEDDERCSFEVRGFGMFFWAVRGAEVCFHRFTWMTRVRTRMDHSEPQTSSPLFLSQFWIPYSNRHRQAPPTHPSRTSAQTHTHPSRS